MNHFVSQATSLITKSGFHHQAISSHASLGPATPPHFTQQIKQLTYESSADFSRAQTIMDPTKGSIFKTYDKPKGYSASNSFATFMIIGRKPPLLSNITH
jgi:hypothetical protein